jgi:pimeloyl-ACP methyl ester carboxylesterase
MLRTRYLKKKLDEYDRLMGELFADCEERSVKSFDGTRIAYRMVGEGEPAIVLSPGVFTTYMFFHYMKDYFKPRHRMIFWDYRGHPDSEVPEDISTINMDSHAKDLAAVMDDAGVEKAVHIGFSMGVMTILELYRQFPGKVAGLVAINGPYGEGFGGFSESMKVQAAICGLLHFLSGHTYLVEWFRPILVLPINIPIAKKVELNPTMVADEEMTLYFEYAAKMDWHAGFQALFAMGVYDGSDILDTVKVPTLLICGSNDTWTPRRIADEMHRRIKGSEYTTIPGGSHATPAENPEMINFRIDLWLRTYFHEIMEEYESHMAAARAKPSRKQAKKPGKKAAAKKRGRPPGKKARKPAKKTAKKVS